MKHKFLPLFAFLLLAAFTAGAQGIAFQKGSWSEIKAKAKAENKHIFVDAYTTWCGPCKWQSKKVFPQKEVGDFFNKNYISFKMDMEKGEGVDFAKKYKVRAYPTLVYFNPQGEMVHKTVGAYPAKVLLKAAANALNPETQVFTLKRRFEKGEKSNEFLQKYIAALEGAYEDFSKPADMYLAQLGKDKWATAEGWKFISKYVRKSSAEAFEYVMKNQAKFEKAAESKEKVEKYITRVLMMDMRGVARSKDKKQLTTFKKKLKDVFGKDADKHIAKAEYMFYAGDKEKAMQYACKYFDKYCDNAYEFNSIAWGYYKKYNDTERLEKALGWAQQSVKLMKKSFNTDTQAHLLFKLKRYKEAKKVAEESIALAKEAKQNAKETKALLEKINAKL
ncbi:hypothetical protein BKI52_25175 [marine bacterium AO1-C]|nr:hypothetical protein BKI52_25175 [marine bacterium AO1-C]